jgi:hypothetical protein
VPSFLLGKTQPLTTYCARIQTQLCPFVALPLEGHHPLLCQLLPGRQDLSIRAIDFRFERKLHDAPGVSGRMHLNKTLGGDCRPHFSYHRVRLRAVGGGQAEEESKRVRCTGPPRAGQVRRQAPGRQGPCV